MKNFVAVSVPIIIVAALLLLVIGAKKKQSLLPMSTDVTDAVVQKEKQQWGLCWEDYEERRCGVVKKIIFHGPEKQIVKMRVYHPSTAVTVDFFRDPGSAMGTWVQPGESGIWTLEATDNGYKGTITNYKGWEASLVVEKIVRIK